MAPLDADAVAAEGIFQEGFERVLADDGHFGQFDAGAAAGFVVKSQGAHGVRTVQDGLEQSELLEQRKRIRMKGQRIAVFAGPNAGVDDADRHALAGEGEGGEQADRAGANDEYIGMIFVRHGGILKTGSWKIPALVASIYRFSEIWNG